jgi:hypothetical protein
MAGVAPQARGSIPRHVRRAVSLTAAAALLAVLLVAGRSADPSPAAAALQCPALPGGLAPKSGPSANRFTMMIRINTQGNVDTYTKPDGGMGSRIRPQDIFVLNTRFGGSGQFDPMTPSEAANLSAQLHASFPCNRIISLNGMSYDPSSPGFALTSLDDPNVWGVLSDFEQSDWNGGRATDPARPPWTNNFAAALPRIKGWDFGMASAAAGNPVGAGKRTGLAPQDLASWNYGQIAQDLNKKNARLGGRKRGPQSVQTQDECADGGASGFGARAKQLRLQYTFKFITKKIKVRTKKGKKRTKKIHIRRPLHKRARPSMGNLAMEISFTDSPQASASQAILSTSAAEAAACVPKGLKQGIGAFFFFASDDSMRLLFQQPRINALRPPGASGSGSTGGVNP